MKKTVIKFYSKGCTPCRYYAPVFEKIKQELQEEVIFIDVNVENDPNNITGQYKVRGIPHTVILENSQEIKKYSGGMTEEQLRDFIIN